MQKLVCGMINRIQIMGKINKVRIKIMEIREILTEELNFYKMMIKFKNSLAKSTLGEFLVNLEISKVNGRWWFELRDACNTSNDNDLFLHEIYKLDDESVVFNLYNAIINFHMQYAKQTNVRIWCWNMISVPEEISNIETRISIDLTPIQMEILEVALSKIKSNPNHLSMNFRDNSPVNYNLRNDHVVAEYKNLIRNYENNFYNDIEIIDYTEKYTDEMREMVLEEESRLSIEINDLLENDGLYRKGLNEF